MPNKPFQKRSRSGTLSNVIWHPAVKVKMKKKKRKSNSIIIRTPEELAEALGLPKSIVNEWYVRHELTSRICHIFEKSHITRTDLAKRAETSRSRISRIIKKDTSSMSLELLLRVLGALGQKVTLDFSKAV